MKKRRESAHGTNQCPAEGEGKLFEFNPITDAEAEKLVDDFLGTEDDRAVWSFIRLLHGVVHAHLNRRHLGHDHSDVESLVNVAARRAYLKTIHSEDALERFAMLDPNDRAVMHPGVVTDAEG